MHWKQGATPHYQWDFSRADLENAEQNDDSIEALVTPSVVLTVGNHSVKLYRTFLARLYLNDNNLVTITFDLLDSRDWQTQDEFDDVTEAQIQLFNFINNHNYKLGIPEYEDVCEDARSAYQDEINDICSNQA